MTREHLLIAVLSVSLSAGPVGAQITAQADVSYYNGTAGVSDCVDVHQGPPPTQTVHVSCALTGAVGTGSASATGTASTRAVSSAAGLSASSVMYGYTVSGIGLLNGHVTFVNPAAGAGTSMLIFRMAVTASESLSNPGDIYEAAGTSTDAVLSGFQTVNHAVVNQGQGEIMGRLVNGVPTTRFTGSAGPDGDGFAVRLPFSLADGTFFYVFTGISDASLQPRNSSASSMSSVTAVLNSIDAVDANGNVIGSAKFDQSGNGIISFAASTPEPSPVALLLPGLACLVPVVRRRQA